MYHAAGAIYYIEYLFDLQFCIRRVFPAENKSGMYITSCKRLLFAKGGILIAIVEIASILSAILLSIPNSP